jgi:hypothetical protein
MVVVTSSIELTLDSVPHGPDSSVLVEAHSWLLFYGWVYEYIIEINNWFAELDNSLQHDKRVKRIVFCELAID